MIPSFSQHDAQPATFYSPSLYAQAKIVWIAPLVLLALTLSSCASAIRLDNSLLARLSDRGPVALSSDNPFLASNLLVAKECERSPEMKGFVKHRGPPAAIEVIRETFEPVRIKFYYTDRAEYYLFEAINETWMISGPFLNGQEPGPASLAAGDKGTQRALLQLSEAEAEKTAVEEPETPAEEAAPVVTDSPAATQAPRPFLKGRSSAVSGAFPVESFKSPASPEMLSESEPVAFAAEASKSTQPAELSPRGDLVHYVTFSGETISNLARWYTGDRNNASRIAHINGIKNPDMLSLGDAIVIPSYLLKNTNRLTEDALREIQRSVHSGEGVQPSGRMEP